MNLPAGAVLAYSFEPEARYWPAINASDPGMVPDIIIMVRYPGDGNTFLPLACPPAVGDLITLQPDPAPAYQEGGPFFRVIDRMWSHPAYGSQAWPYGTPDPRVGPSLDIIVEPAEGLYPSEVPEEGS